MSEKKQRIYLSSPHMGGHELDYVHEAFETNWIAPLGANVNGFEEDLQKFTGRKHAAVVTSGTAAIHLGLILCGVKPGDDVLCQSFTFAATANPIRYLGGRPVFVDSEPETWNMDPELLEKAIIDRVKDTGKKPKAVIVVHLYGMPAKMGRIQEIADKYDIPVIEDAAEALGSTFHGHMCGAFGRFSVLSFNGNKIITTSGGGALLSDDQKLVKKARFLATQARDEAPHYQHSQLGYNYRMSNIVAGIGRGQMKVIDDRIERRRAIHDIYFQEFGETWFVLNEEMRDRDVSFAAFSFQYPETAAPTGIYFLREPEGCTSNRWLTTILVNPEETGGITREDIRIAMEKENIECRPLWKPMHMQPLYEDFPFYSRQPLSGEQETMDSLKGKNLVDEGLSGWLFKFGLCLPSGSNMNDEDLKRVVKAIKEVIPKSFS